MPRSIDYMHVVISSEYSTDLANDQQVYRGGCQMEAISRPFKKIFELRLQPREFLKRKMLSLNSTFEPGLAHLHLNIAKGTTDPRVEFGLPKKLTLVISQVKNKI